jgi:hypothetical protein
MSEFSTQDLFVWSDKLRQASEQRARSKADVHMLETAVDGLSEERASVHHSSSQLEFARSEYERVCQQYEIALGMTKKIIDDLVEDK